MKHFLALIKIKVALYQKKKQEEHFDTGSHFYIKTCELIYILFFVSIYLEFKYLSLNQSEVDTHVDAHTDLVMQNSSKRHRFY